MVNFLSVLISPPWPYGGSHNLRGQKIQMPCFHPYLEAGQICVGVDRGHDGVHVPFAIRACPVWIPSAAGRHLGDGKGEVGLGLLIWGRRGKIWGHGMIIHQELRTNSRRQDGELLHFWNLRKKTSRQRTNSGAGMSYIIFLKNCKNTVNFHNKLLKF